MMKNGIRRVVALALIAGAFASVCGQLRQYRPAYTNDYGASQTSQFLRDANGSRVSDLAGNRLSSDGFTIPGSDVEMLIGGRLRHEGLFVDKAMTLRDDFNDRYAFNRTKATLDFYTQQGVKTYGAPVVDMHVALTSCFIWDDVGLYTPVLEEKIFLNRGNHLKETAFDTHTHRGVVPLLYLDEGWFRLYLNNFLEIGRPTTIKLGYFPFILGRGMVLGDYFDGAEKHLGWQTPGNPGNATQTSPGILLSSELASWCTGELYYSLWKKRSHGPDFTRKMINARRLDIADRDTIGSLERGTGNDTTIVAARLGIRLEGVAEGKVYLEPYGLYVSAPELTVEYEGDSAARIFTVGCMAEYNRNGFTCNVEAACQVGTQVMHPIDRNTLILDDAYYQETHTSFNALDINGGTLPDILSSGTGGRLDKTGGQLARYNSHVLLGVDKPGTSVSEYLPYRAYYVDTELTDVINADANRALNAQGKELSSPDGTPYVSQEFTDANHDAATAHQYGSYLFKTGVDYYDTLLGVLSTTPNGKLFNSNIPFGYGKRFRPAYTLSIAGYTWAIDCAYELESKRARFACAAAYMSGDAYPFNEEIDKTYRGFTPFKNANYVGRHVTSFALLYCRKTPRPTEFVDGLLAAENAYESTTNLAYVGISGQCYLDTARTLRLEGNLLHFWMPHAPQAWDRAKKRQFGDTKVNDLYAYTQKQLTLFSGAAAGVPASTRLGIEVNTVLAWRISRNFECTLRAGIFIPGQLYHDIEGMPNKNTIRYDRDGRRVHDTLGTKTAFGGMLRASYTF